MRIAKWCVYVQDFVWDKEFHAKWGFKEIMKWSNNLLYISIFSGHLVIVVYYVNFKLTWGVK